MDVELEAVVGRFFEVRAKKGWSSFHSPLARAAGFGTTRVGKFGGSGPVLFTFGETEQGRKLGLTRRIEQVVAEAGFRTIRERSTNGSRPDKFYTGFDAFRAEDERVAQVLRGVTALLEEASGGQE